MFRILSLLTLVVLLASPPAAPADDAVTAAAVETPATQPAQENVLQTYKDKLSYSIGLDIARAMKERGFDIDVDLLARGIKDGLAGGPTLLTPEQVQEVMRKWQAELRAKQEEERAKLMAERQAAGEKNLKASEEFLAANKEKEGVVTLPNGLQYKVIEEGSGTSPTDTDRVKVGYRGTLIDGTEFDSSPPGEPRVFALRGLIKGWSEALKMMKPGAKWQLFIPPDLAYGPAGRGPKIGPNAALIFDVELVGIEPPASPPAPATPPPAAP